MIKLLVEIDNIELIEYVLKERQYDGTIYDITFLHCCINNNIKLIEFMLIKYRIKKNSYISINLENNLDKLNKETLNYLKLNFFK